MVTCAACGRASPADARFCAECGTRLDARAGHEVRKIVTVLFTDVAGSTVLGEELDAESLRHVMSRYFELARHSVERNGGTVEKFIGDAVMAVFGVPTMHEDDALRALRAASELHSSLEELNRELERDYGVSLELRTGVNTGEVVTGTEERLVTGDAVNVAARLEQAAAPGEILVGQPTVRLARDAIEVERVESLTLKGKHDPVGAYRLLRVIEGAPPISPRIDTLLIGRSTELAALRDAFDAAVRERRCRLVTVIGPPGIGKSRIARELGHLVADEATVLLGRCPRYGEGVTFTALADMLRAAAATTELDAALAAPGPEEMFWSVRKLLEERARKRPLVLIAEDVHWAEPTFLDLIEHLAEWTRDAPILLLCLARPEMLEGRPGWIGERLRLDVLSEDESDQLIDARVGGVTLQPEIRAQVHERAGGHPLYVEQLLALVAEGGNIEQIPDTIQALLATRLDALPSGEREIIERASVVGMEFGWSALAGLADGERPSGASLAALVRKELIAPDDAAEDAFRFRHALIRDAAYERIPKTTRAALHERCADMVGSADEPTDELIGYHLEQSYRSMAAVGRASDRALALAERAAQHLVAAGLEASTKGDAAAAANLLERAVALLPAESSGRLVVLPPLGRALMDVGRMGRAGAVLGEAVAGAQAVGDRLIAADAAILLANLRLHAAPQEGIGQAEVWHEIETAIPIFEESHDDAGLARAVTIAGALRFWRGEAAAALDDFDRATAHARRAGDRGQELEIAAFQAVALVVGPTPVDDALTRIAEIGSRVSWSRGIGVHLGRARAELEAMRGDLDLGRSIVADVKRLALELGNEMAVARVGLHSGAIERWAGDVVAAERELRASYDAYTRMQNWGYLTSVAVMLADALAALGREDEALALTEQVEELAVPEDVDAQGGWRRVRAKLLARRGAMDEALRLSAEATALLDRTDFLSDGGDALSDQAEVLRFAGRLEEADDAHARAFALYEQKGNIAAANNLRRSAASETAG